MNDDLDKLLVDKIFEKLSFDPNPVDYLMDLLHLSRKSVYRRRKGDLPFSFEEIVILAKELDFSIDALVAKSNENQAIFTHKTDILFDPKETFISMLEKYLEFYKKAAHATSFEGFLTMNRILLIYALDTTHLFRFFYYMWVHQGDNIPVNFRYSEMDVPPEILALSQKVLECVRSIGRTTIILDELVFKNIFNEIAYYYQRELLTTEEYIQLKDELLAYIKRLELIVSLGTNEYGSNYAIYLSTLNIESNSCYYKIDDDIESSFWVFGISPIYTNNNFVFTSHRKWINSLKKYSSLISQSNELLQSKFFNEQYNYIVEASANLLSDRSNGDYAVNGIVL
ncbi:MAG: hypothetical protein LBK45_00965 [Tannerellaceae bacterium]|jgi:hypothetical protein|nr:hypothetical protein [Tannerellaceae bacterium]